MTDTDSPSLQHIRSLALGLESEDATQRINARTALIEAGAAAVDVLVTCLHSPTQHVRWEAAKALESIAAPAAAPALVSALADEDQDVRWVAGAALIALGEAARAPLLMGLIRQSSSVDFCRSAHHVLRDLAKGAEGSALIEVIEALDSAEPGVAAPPAAWHALRALQFPTDD